MTWNPYFLEGVNHTEATDNATKKRVQVNDGFLVGVGSELAVIQNTPAAMNVIIGTGEAWILGVRCENPAPQTLTVTAADATYSRIDRIVVRLSWAGNTVAGAYVEGTPAASPAAPALAVDGTELGLCTILVTAGKTSILTADITDTRLTSACGVGGCRMGYQHVDTDGTFNFGTKRATNLVDPVNAQDAETKAHAAAANTADIAAAIAALDLTGIPRIYGDGSDGTVALAAPTSYSGLKQFTTFSVNNGVTLTLTGDTVIFAQTSITIAGTITGSIAGGAGGAGGNGAEPYTGGTGSAGTTGGTSPVGGGGAGGAGGASNANGATGGNGVIRASASSVKLMPHAFATLVLSGIVGHASGGGGGGGGGVYNYDGGAGGAGGNGGAILILIAPTITFTGAITLNGTNGAAGTVTANAGDGGAGGNGAGGVCVLAGRTVTDSGTFTATNSGWKQVVVI